MGPDSGVTSYSGDFIFRMTTQNGETPFQRGHSYQVLTCDGVILVHTCIVRLFQPKTIDLVNRSLTPSTLGNRPS